MRRAALGAILAALLPACSEGPPAEGAGPPAAGEQAVAAAPGPAPTAADPELAACLEQRVRGPGYDGRSRHDARRRLKWLQAKADCEAQLRR